MTGDRWQVTRDTWYMTRDMTHDTLHIVWDEHSLKILLPSSSGLELEVLWRYLNWRMNESMNELIKDGGDCRTAPATQGLLNNKSNHKTYFFSYFY